MCEDVSSERIRQTHWHLHWLQARQGCRFALGELLQSYRPYLLEVADQELGKDLRSKISPMDVVQETFLEAIRDFFQFQGENETAWKNWLRQLLKHNLSNQTRHYRHCSKRNLRRERFTLDVLELQTICTIESRPEQKLIQEEMLAFVRQQIRLLPSIHQASIELLMQNYSIREIANYMNRSVSSTSRLCHQGLTRLRQLVQSNEQL